MKDKIILNIDPSDLDIIKIKIQIIQKAFDQFPSASLGLMSKKLNIGPRALWVFCKKHNIKLNYESGGKHIDRKIRCNQMIYNPSQK